MQKMGSDQKGFLLYLDNYDLIEDISNEEKGKWIDAVFRYKRYGEIPDFQKGTLLNTAFKVTKSQLDRDSAAWEEKRQKRAEAGQKGGLAKAGNNKQLKAKSSNAKQGIANLAVNVTDKVNDSVSVIDTDTDTVIDTDTEQAYAVSVDRPVGSAVANADPPAGDLFSVEQLKVIAEKNKVNLTEEGILVFHEEMQKSGWILFQKPVEKKGIVKALRGWTKYHLEYGQEVKKQPSKPKQTIEDSIYIIARRYITKRRFKENPGGPHTLIANYVPKECFTQEQLEFMADEWCTYPRKERYVLKDEYWDEEERTDF